MKKYLKHLFKSGPDVSYQKSPLTVSELEWEGYEEDKEVFKILSKKDKKELNKIATKLSYVGADEMSWMDLFSLLMRYQLKDRQIDGKTLFSTVGFVNQY